MFKNIKKALLLGFLLWFLPFFTSFLFFSLSESQPLFYKSFVSVLFGLLLVLFAFIYFAQINKNHLFSGLILSLIWLAICLFFDLVIFGSGLIKMKLGDYLTQIGLIYLLIPALCISWGLLLQKQNKSNIQTEVEKVDTNLAPLNIDDTTMPTEPMLETTAPALIDELVKPEDSKIESNSFSQPPTEQKL